MAEPGLNLLENVLYKWFVIAEIRKIATNPRYRYLLDCGESDLRKQRNQREYRLCSGGSGAILKATIDNTNMFYSLGNVSAEEFQWIHSFSGKGELHFEHHQANNVLSIKKPHMSDFSEVRFYHLQLRGPYSKHKDVERLTPQNFEEIQNLVLPIYPGASFVLRMLQFPFFGIRDQGKLIATGGIIFWERAMGLCQVGSFFTHPEVRGKGHCNRIIEHLLAELKELGVRHVRLEVYASNLPARKSYEKFGFQVEKKGLEMLISV